MIGGNKVKRLSILFTLLLLFLVGCGSNNDSSSTSSDEQNKAIKVEASDNEKVELDTQNINGFAVGDDLGFVYIHGAVALKNTGETALRINEVQFNFEAKDGSIIGTETPLSAMPVIIKPGETSIAGATFTDEDTKLIDQFDKVTVNVDYVKTTDEPSKWKIDNLKGRKTDLGYKYTGKLTNQMDEKTGQIWMTFGMFDEKGNILATMYGHPDVTLNPGASTGFESFSDFDMPDFILNKVDHVEVGIISAK